MARTKRFTVPRNGQVVIPASPVPQAVELDGRLLKITPIEQAAKPVLECEPTSSKSRDASNRSAE